MDIFAQRLFLLRFGGGGDWQIYSLSAGKEPALLEADADLLSDRR